jgi:hypothetical protein
METYVADCVAVDKVGLVTVIVKANNINEAWEKILKHIEENYGDTYAKNFSAFGYVEVLPEDEVYSYVDSYFKNYFENKEEVKE